MKIETITDAVNEACALTETLQKLVFKESSPVESALLQTIFGDAVDLEIKLEALLDAAKAEAESCNA